ncbi:MAG: hypothetical protein AAF328_01165 [Planctomycetota bacterium]
MPRLAADAPRPETDRPPMRDELQTEHGLIRPGSNVHPDLLKLLRQVNAEAESVLAVFSAKKNTINRDGDLNASGKTKRITEASETARWQLFRNVKAPALKTVERMRERLELPSLDTPVWRPSHIDTSDAGAFGREVRTRLGEPTPASRRLFLLEQARQTTPQAKAILYGVDGADPLHNTAHAFLPVELARELREVHTKALRPDDYLLASQLADAEQVIRTNLNKAEAKLGGGRRIDQLAAEKLSAGEKDLMAYAA